MAADGTARGDMTRLLASVRDADEAAVALEADADIIDLKEPNVGALGAVDYADLHAAVQRVDGRRPVSATVGDLPMQPEPLVRAALRTAAAGADIVKLGLWDGPGIYQCVDALGEVAPRRRLVAVLFADLQPTPSLLPRLAAAGFWGAMLDTADKTGGGLLDHRGTGQLAQFVEDCHSHRLVCGLAGSLTVEDLPHLLPLSPDYLGFRGALCRGNRRAGLDSDACRALRDSLKNQSVDTAAG